MPLDIARLIAEHAGENHELHAQHVNPRFARVLRTIGFDRCYVRAQGAHLWDGAGERYLDMISGYGVFALGRNPPAVRQAIEAFLALEFPSLVQLEAPLLSGLLAAELKRRIGRDLDIVYFTNSGTEGIETAIKFARCATGRPAIIHCRAAFHGLTNGALSLNGDAVFRDGFGPLLPDCRQIAFDDLAALEQALGAGDIAAFVVEPIQGKGVNVPRPGYLTEATRLCHRHGALLIADEVQTGCGRTGRFLALDHEPEARADLVVLSKALSGGYVPVGAVLTRREIYDRVFSSLERSVVHSSTFGQGSLAMVAALATLQALDDTGALAHAAHMGAYLQEQLQARTGRCAFLREIRGRGMMIGIELGEPQRPALRAAWQLVHRIDRSLFAQAVTMPLLDDHHVITQVAGHHLDVIKLLPPLNLSRDDAEWFLGAFDAVMARLERFPGPAWDVLARMGRGSFSPRDGART
jgi:acetylornithine/succinyldiaminopimelate/putrescine aminotransferase